ncbi:hypothetical protein GCM10027413_24410 [Conyzicola nivalis]|uniref:Uncharacterized protein n=1 Tax=Conyzicola nivalis TaxID=1477021 RepID=A0A916SAT6_9MICO|nr:hypothetical protein [Conyzicola nivalis]GGA91116.1 hypothetical protein GCM10010979_02210 [Conyzicola nivalis]
MTIEIDTSRALRTQDQLETLIRAVERAAPEDENRALEWKSGYPDLTTAHASFAIARAILGLANRPVDVAGATFEGVGYVLVGVEPGRLREQLVPDSAELLNALRRFTGHGFPLWDARSVAVEDSNILVITVEPPRPGDRIALLHRSYQSPRGQQTDEGTVFVRQPGATERASRADLDMLQDRLLSGTEADAQAAREAERYQEIRTLIADLVHSANQWASLMQIMVIMSAGEGWSRDSLAEWANSDSGRETGVHAQLISQNARKVRLLTSDEQLVSPVRIAAEKLANGAGAFRGIHGPGPSRDEQRKTAYAHINGVVRAFALVEEIAVDRLSQSLSERVGRTQSAAQRR